VVLRQERSAPLLQALERWATEVAPSVVAGSPLGKAWTYLRLSTTIHQETPNRRPVGIACSV